MKTILALLLAAACVSAVASDDVFIDRQHGIRLVKPSGWQVSPPLPKQEGSDAAKKPERVVQILKHPVEHEGPNPSFVMSIQPLPFAAKGSHPAAMLKRLVPNLTRALPDLEFEIQPRDVTITDIDGTGILPGGEMLFRYTAKDPAGNPYPARARMMYIVRGDHLLSIQTTAPASGPDASNDELSGIIGSLRIAR